MCKVSTMGFFKNVIASLLFVSTGKPGRLKLGHWAEQQRIHLKKNDGSRDEYMFARVWREEKGVEEYKHQW